jgi:hypothetical protein
MNINSDLVLPAGKRVVFVVNGNVNVNPYVQSMDGFYLTNGKFDSGLPTSGGASGVVFFSGFEMGRLSDGDGLPAADGWTSTNFFRQAGGWTPPVPGVRSGQYSAEAEAFDGRDEYARRSIANTTSLYSRIAFLFNIQLPSNDKRFAAYRISPTNVITFKLTTAGKIAVYDATNTKISEGSTILTPDTWYLIEMKAEISFGNDTVELRLNEGAPEFTETTTNFTDSPFFNEFEIGRDGPSAAPYFYFDDVALSEDEYVGDGHVIMHSTTVTGQAPTTGDTLDAGSWENTAEIPPDSPTDAEDDPTREALYTGTPRSGTVQMGDFSEISSSDVINAVKVSAHLERGTGGGTSHFLRLREAGVNRDSPGLGLGNTDLVYRDFMSTAKPSGGFWTKASLDNTEAGFGVSGAQDLKVNGLYIQADYSLSGPGPPIDCPECQLTVSGAVIAFGGFDLFRDVGNSSATIPSEDFKYDPS